MPQLINRAPTGLLSRFDMKAGGQNPSQLPDFIQPVVDISDLYEIDTRLVGSDTFAAPVIGANSLALTPPAGEIWHLQQVGAYNQAPLAAGEAVRFSAGILSSFTATFHALTDRASATVVGDRAMVGQLIDYYLRPGEFVAVWVESLLLTPDLRLVCLYNRFLV